MSYGEAQYGTARPNTAANASVDARADFIVKTYLHLVAAIFAFVFLEFAMFMAGIPMLLMEIMIRTGPIVPIVFCVGFIGTSYLANWWARSDASPVMQYAGLGLYVVAEVVIFMPILLFASIYDQQAIPAAGLVTLVLFGGLTGFVFVTRKDFSFLRGILFVGVLAALGTLVAAAIFGFSPGVWFSGAMILLAGGYILYDTSNVLHHYRTDQHVAAALALFSSVALLFWYVLRIFLQSRR